MTHFNLNKDRQKDIYEILKKNNLLRREMGICIIDLKNNVVGGSTSDKQIFGYNIEHFIYPASVYKIFIGAEVLRRVDIGDFSLGQIIEIKSPNDVDRDARIFPGDNRKLLNAGDMVSIDYLLDLMLSRSDNTASNTLIDLVGRESITKNIIYKYNWQGSEVTRKFLNRIKEEGAYQFSSTTLSCPRHIAEFFYLVENDQLVNEFVSSKLKFYMSNFNKYGKRGLWLKGLYVNYYCKGGWLETNLLNKPFSFLKSLIKRRWGVIQWSNDAGVVTGKNSKYVIVVMSVKKTIFSRKPFPLQKLAKDVFDYMDNYLKP